MFSVIYPTMWKYSPFLDFLCDLVEHPLIGEVIIIDNNFDERPDHQILFNDKIKLITFKRNIFVNPAWNIGISAAQYDKICIGNDDVIFDLRVFNKVNPILEPSIGMIGLSVNYPKENFVDGVIRISEYQQGDVLDSFAVLFFVHKQTYTPIPNGLNLMFGDNFTFDNSLWTGKKILSIKDIFYYTPQATTVSQLPNLTETYKKEAFIYKTILESKGLDPYVWNASLKSWLQ